VALAAPLRVYRFCRSDGSLTLAVVILTVFLFALYPMIEVGVVPAWSLDASFTIFLIAGAIFVFEPKPIVRVFVALVVATLVARLLEFVVPSRALTTLQSLLVVASSIGLSVLLISRVLRDGRINVHRIVGACGTFLLLGLVFAQLSRILALYIPGAYAMFGQPAEYDQLRYNFVYYSFVTLTTTGFGDITPIHPYARSLAAFEALIGTLYLAVLIARLVALEMEWREEQRERERYLAETEAAQPSAGVPPPTSRIPPASPLGVPRKPRP
jgi:hypothetical protein